jgi:hypothetical protein
MSTTEKITAVQTVGVNVGCPTLASVRELLGPSWIIESEDPERYEKVLAEVGAAVQPIDFIDWLLVKDIVDLTWEIQRARLQRQRLMRTAQVSSLRTVIAQAGLSMADIDLQSLSAESVKLERLDERDERLAGRRDDILRQIERRRSGWAKLVRRASEEIIEGEFRELPSDTTDVGAGRQACDTRIRSVPASGMQGLADKRPLPGAKRWSSTIDG